MGINNSKYWNEALETQSRDELEAQQLKDLKEIVHTIMLLTIRDHLMQQV